jgi:outer membrane receptor protein involved in Fe transport
MFMKVDGTLGHVEAVRGGQSAVLGSNSPAGIINFITKTGEDQGGSVGVSKGLGFNENRIDFDYGGHLSDSTRFFVGGFFRQGDGLRDSSSPIESGGEIKGNITHDLGGGSFIRLTFKHLDDQTPTDLPVLFSPSNGAVIAAATKGNPITIGALAGIDPLKASYYSPYWPGIVTRNANNTLTTTDLNNGLTVRENALGLVGSFNLGNGWALDDTLRKSTKSGGFEGAYPTGPSFAASAGTIYAAGPNAGKPYAGGVTELAAFNASFDDLGSTVNALKLSKTFNLAGSSKLTALFGWDLNQQIVDVTQNLPHYLFTTSSNPIPLNGLNGGGVATDATGLLPTANGWGATTRATKYTVDSPYVSLSYEAGPWNLDAGLRRDMENASGCQSNAGAPAAATPFIPGLFPTTCGQTVNYSVSNNSYSLGADYRVSKDLAFFAHYSDGASFNVIERLGSQPLDGSAPIPINTVKQLEGGVKWRAGGFSSFVTLFNAKTSESNYDLTTGITTANTYNANGVEIEASYRQGGFNVSGGFTYVDATISTSNVASAVGNEPHRLAPYTYQVSPSFTFGEFTVGGSVIGTAKSYGDDQNTIIMPAFATVNMFGNYQFDMHTSVWFSANNLFNRIGWTEYDAGQGARSINGRTMKAGIKYTF